MTINDIRITEREGGPFFERRTGAWICGGGGG